MGYRLYNPITKKVIFSRDVIFEENESWNWDQTKASRSAELISEEETREVATEPQIPRDQQTPQRGSSSPQRYDAPLPIERDFSDMMPRRTCSLEDLYENTEQVEEDVTLYCLLMTSDPIVIGEEIWMNVRARQVLRFFMGDTAFTWSSKKQAIVTLSSCEAEYVATCSAVCHETLNSSQLTVSLSSASRLLIPLALGLCLNEVQSHQISNGDLVPIGGDPPLFPLDSTSIDCETQLSLSFRCITRLEQFE
ncbi:hypothetical protein EZV62_027862 [Acer yangbiense]|uniref:Retroviral polymerase SH3-like domain-containing protein n=1 Tax=Acer yangbiense TaxID=1000413 RepID=A0A5C7GPZ4_9ROSI|nr:hypothetical protein EZV62_027862 [Acer yangbiense]